MYFRYRLLIGAYVIWITAVILFVCAQIGLLPLYGIVEQIVFVGTMIGVVIGAIRIPIRGATYLRTLVDNHHESFSLVYWRTRL